MFVSRLGVCGRANTASERPRRVDALYFRPVLQNMPILAWCEYIDDDRNGRIRVNGETQYRRLQRKYEDNENGDDFKKSATGGDSSVPRGSARNRVLDGDRRAAAINGNYDHLGGPVDDPIGSPRDSTGVGSGDSGIAEG